MGENEHVFAFKQKCDKNEMKSPNKCAILLAERSDEAMKNKNNLPFRSREDCAEKLRQYFEEYLPASGEVADVEGLADFLGTTRADLTACAAHKRYGEAVRCACNRIAKIKKQLAFAGKLPAAVLAFDLKNNHGYLDRPDDQLPTTQTVILKGLADGWTK